MHELNILVDESEDTENVADNTGHNSDECEDTRDEVSADGQDLRLFFWLSTLENDGGCERRQYKFRLRINMIYQYLLPQWHQTMHKYSSG